MQSLSPTSRYLLALKEGSHQPDDVQQEAVSRLDTIYHELQNKPVPAPQSSGLRAKFGKLLGKREPAVETAAVRGLYMWGGVGRGKTWLMDLFIIACLAIVSSACTSIASCCASMKSWWPCRGTATRWKSSPTASRRKPTFSVSMSFCLRYY